MALLTSPVINSKIVSDAAEFWLASYAVQYPHLVQACDAPCSLPKRLHAHMHGITIGNQTLIKW